jgi:hypothetical protein
MVNVSLNLEKCHFGCTKGILFGHIVSQDGIHTNHANIEKVKSSFSQNKETIASIFRASELLPKVHKGVCNPCISPQQIFQTRVRDCGGRKGD